MTLNDREKFILHLVALMTMQHFGMFGDKTALHEVVRKNRCRKLSPQDVGNLFDDIQEEMLLGKTIYEEVDLPTTNGENIFTNGGSLDDNEVDEHGTALGGR